MNVRPPMAVVKKNVRTQWEVIIVHVQQEWRLIKTAKIANVSSKNFLLENNKKSVFASAKLTCNELENNPILIKQPNAKLACGDDERGRCILDGQDVGSFYLKPEVRYSFTSSAKMNQVCSNATNTAFVEISFLTDACDLETSFETVSKGKKTI